MNQLQCLLYACRGSQHKMTENKKVMESSSQEISPKKAKNSWTKTIRFNTQEKILYDNWNIAIVKEFKRFLVKRLTAQQQLAFKLGKSKNPESERTRRLNEKMKLFKFMVRKDASKEALDRLEREITLLNSLKF